MKLFWRVFAVTVGIILACLFMYGTIYLEMKYIDERIDKRVDIRIRRIIETRIDEGMRNEVNEAE